MKKKVLSIILVVIIVLSVLGCVEGGEGEGKGRRYCISATYDEESKKLTGEVVLEYAYQGENSLTNLLFFVYANIYREQNCGMTVTSVYADGKQIGFVERGDKDTLLDIPLPREIFKGDRIEVSINYEIKIPEGKGILGYVDDFVKLSGFYPVLCVLGKEGWVENSASGYGDLYFSEKADYEVRLTVDKRLSVASSGRRVSKIESDKGVTYTYNGENIRDFAFVVGDYECVSGTIDGVLVSAYAKDIELCEKILSYAQKSLTFYNSHYGKYSHPTLSLAECPLSAGGMEFSSFVMIGEELGEDLEEVVAHEVAHQWWYDGVGSNPTKYAWLDEGLTEYSTLEYLSEERGITYYRDRLRERYRSYTALCSIESVSGGRGDIAMSKDSDKFSSLYEYVSVTYTKGLLFFDNLQEITGKSLTNKVLRKYYSAFSGGISTPEDLKECFASICRINYEVIFSAWEEGRVIFRVE